MILCDERTDLTAKEWIAAATRNKVDKVKQDFARRFSSSYRKPTYRNILSLSPQEVERLKGEK